MSLVACTPLPPLAQRQVTEISQEQAYDLACILTEKMRYDGPVTVFRGFCPEHGTIYIAIPAFGNALILPVANQSIVL